MTGSPWADVGAAAAGAAVACAGWAGLGLGLAKVAGRYNVVDTIWGPGFALVAAADLLTGVRLGHGDPLRRGLLLGGTAIWGARLAWHVGRRSAGKGEDPRYAELLEKGRGGSTARAVALIFAPQAATLFVVSLPLQAGMVNRGPVGWLGWAGVAVWLTGFAIEAIGDAQMSRFKADPANKGKIADTGLWSYTRHPNYFGDATVWTGLYLIAAERWPGALTFAGPALMIYLLDRGTGKRLLERSMADRPGYRDYMRRTSGFVPLPHRVHERWVQAHEH